MAANALLLPQLDRLASLIDQRVFTCLRMHLLDPEAHPALLPTLNCLLEMLPQSSAGAKLRRTLKTASSDVMGEVNRRMDEMDGRPKRKRDGGAGVKEAAEVARLVGEFEKVQEIHDALRTHREEGSRERSSRSARGQGGLRDDNMSPLEALKQLCSDNMQAKLLAAVIVLRMASQGGEVQKSLAREGGVPLLVSVLWTYGVPGEGRETVLARSLKPG